MKIRKSVIMGKCATSCVRRRLDQRPFTFIFVLTAAILLSIFSTLNPYLLKITVDDYITLKDYNGILVFIGIMTGVLFLEVFLGV